MKNQKTRQLSVVAMLSGIGFILMFLELSVPVMPAFIKLDFSELPAILASFAYGPLAGGAVCLIKNVLHLLVTNTGGVGELSNFLLGLLFVLPAGWIYRKHKNRKGALLGAAVGCVVSALGSVPVNYFLVYPLYGTLMPMEGIIGAYQALNSHVKNLWDALVWFNMPFTLVKELAVSGITFLVYKKLSPVLHGRK